MGGEAAGEVQREKESTIAMSRKLFIYTLICLVFAGELCASGFRGFPWGVDVDTVKAGETAELKKELPTALLYVGTVAGTEMMISFDFAETGLAEGSMSTIHFQPSVKQLEMYHLMGALLSKKYGEPAENTTIWHDHTLKHRPDKLELALALGHVEFSCRWNLEDTVIRTSLSMSNGEVLVWVNYCELERDNAKQQAIENELLDGL
jgi:hypothetical protein